MAKNRNIKGISGNPARRAGQKAVERDHKLVLVKPANFFDWLYAARPRTLFLALAAVSAGLGIARMATDVNNLVAILTVLGVVFIQIAVNYANDYSDGIRGTDDRRSGPSRLTASRKVKAKTVLIVAIIFAGLSAISGGLAIILSEHYWLLLVGVLALLAGWFYTGGKKPYGYFGFGEVISFIFFGPAATVGTVYLQLDKWSQIPQEAWIIGLAIGCFAAAALLVNNIRDYETDSAVGKKTLVVFIKPLAAKILYVVLMLLPNVASVILVLAYPNGGLMFLHLFFSLSAIIIVLLNEKTRDFIVALSVTALAAFSYGLLAGFIIGF